MRLVYDKMISYPMMVCHDEDVFMMINPIDLRGFSTRHLIRILILPS